MFGPSARVLAVQAPVIPVVADLIRRNPGAISLGQGVVHYGPPDAAWARVSAFRGDPENHKYKAVVGLPELVEALGSKQRLEHGVETGGRSGRELVVTAGGNQAFMSAVLAVTEPGDEVILLAPYYFNHEMALTLAGVTPVVVPTVHGTFQPDLDRIRDAITDRTRGVVTVSPNNPTGAVYPAGVLRAINQLCAERGVFHIHDEAYDYFVYGGVESVSAASFAGSEGHTLTLHSMSKAYGFASWRIGWMVIPAGLLESVRKIQDTIQICPPVISQHAALGALGVGRGYCVGHRAGLELVRRSFLDSLGSLSPFCEVAPAEGAFYLMVRLATRLTPMEVVERLIARHGVGVIPGDAFGLQPESGCWLRVAYGVLTPQTADVALGRLVSGFRALALEAA